MKISLTRETLLKPLQIAIGAVGRKQTLLILSHVLLSIKGDKLTVTGTDAEIELTGQSKVKNLENNAQSMTLPGKKLFDICRSLPDNAPIQLNLNKEQAILRSGRSHFKLSTLPVEHFPISKRKKSFFTFTMKEKQLKQLLNRTCFAMAQQDLRYYLNGILLEIQANQLVAVATDGHRLALNTSVIASSETEKFSVIVPRKGVSELSRLLEDRESEILITFSTGHIHVTSEDFCFTSKLVDGEFPNYQRVIPNNGDKSLLIDRDLFKQSLNRSAILCNEKYKSVRFEVTHNLLRISANNPEQESAEEELSVDYTDEALDIGFNVNYMLDILNVASPGLIKLIMTNSSSSILVKEQQDEWQSAFIVMPMRL